VASAANLATHDEHALLSPFLANCVHIPCILLSITNSANPQTEITVLVMLLPLKSNSSNTIKYSKNALLSILPLSYTLTTLLLTISAC